MSKSRNKIPQEIKAQILTELQAPGCTIPKLVKEYNVSNTTIRTWQRETLVRAPSEDDIVGSSNFVELSVKDSRNFTLEKASLTFNDFSLVIEGKVRSSSLLAIVKILEEQSC